MISRRKVETWLPCQALAKQLRRGKVKNSAPLLSTFSNSRRCRGTFLLCSIAYRADGNMMYEREGVEATWDKALLVPSRLWIDCFWKVGAGSWKCRVLESMCVPSSDMTYGVLFNNQKLILARNSFEKPGFDKCSHLCQSSCNPLSCPPKLERVPRNTTEKTCPSDCNTPTIMIIQS